jgi:hypothetical protein
MLFLLEVFLSYFVVAFIFVYAILAIWMRICEPEEYKLAKKEIKEWITKRL